MNTVMSSTTTIPLHSLEISRAFSYRSVSAISFFRGSLPSEYISKKIVSIVQLNPWLNGFLKKSPTGANISFQNPLPDASDIEKKHLRVIDDDSLNENFPFREYFKRYANLLVKFGSECLNKENESLFRIILISIAPEKFAIICSLSHVLGDGHTFYSIYGMLSQSVAAYSLNRLPLSNFESQSESAMNGDDSKAFLSSPSTIIRLILLNTFQSRQRDYLFLLDEKWIAQEKSTAVRLDPSCSFVSTNDVVTSWFFRLVRSNVALMAANMRDRLPGLGNANAGNYQVGVAYQPADYATPTLVRKSIADPNRIARVASGALPGPLATLFGDFRIGIMTNWSTFYQDLVLEGCKQIVHFPIMGPGGGNYLTDMAIIFRPNKGQLAAYVGTRSCSDEVIRSQGIYLSPLLGEIRKEKSEKYSIHRNFWFLLAIALAVTFISFYYSK